MARGTAAEVDELHGIAAELGLTQKQRRFCELLEADIDRNQKRAAEGAGCGKGAKVTATNWLKRASVRKYLQVLREMVSAPVVVAAQQLERRETKRRIMDATEVLERLTEHATADIADFVTLMDPSGPREGETREDKQARDTLNARGFIIDIPKAIAAGKSHLIKEIGFDKQGLPKLRVVDTQSALDKLAKYHRLYRDNEGDTTNQTLNVTLLQVMQERPRLAVDMAKALLSGGRKRS